MLTLPERFLRFAIADAIVDGVKLKTLIEKLFREDPEEVRRIYDEIATQRITLGAVSMAHRRSEEAKRRPVLTRRRRGLRVAEIADHYRIHKTTLTALMEHHGFLECVPCGGRQRRMLVTDQAFYAEVGHNVYPVNRIGYLEGQNKAAVFPVFYPERLDDIMWCLDYEGIKTAVLAQPAKKARFAWLLANHSYLPDREIASLAGYSERGVRKARANGCKPNTVRRSSPASLPSTAPAVSSAVQLAQL